MQENLLFYIVFLIQILLISFYYPRKILNRVFHVFSNYPAKEYPKLYPKSKSHYEKWIGYYKVINNIILMIGFIFIIFIGLWDNSNDGKISEIIPFIYWVIQIIPILFLEYFGFAYSKLMRKADLRTTRKANLQPRRLFNFVSPYLIVIALVLLVACIGFFYSVHKFQFHPSNDTFVIAIALLLSNGLFAGIIYWNLYGKKQDPYQAGRDRLRQIEVTIKSLVYMSIVASIFLITIEAIEQFNLVNIKPVLMSLYLQFTVFIGLGTMLRNLRVENIDFEVYKADVNIV